MKAGIAGAAAIVVLIGAGLYLSYELGRLNAGYSLLDERRQNEIHEAAIAARDESIDTLARRIAILETSGEIDRETYADVESNLAALEARIQAQEEELVFYRGIVSPGDGVAGLRIQSVEVEAGEDTTSPVLRILLVQAIVHSERVTGSVRASLRGTLRGAEAEFGLDELGSESRASDIPYGFRYFQTLELGLSLPEGFVPAELELEVWPRSPRGETIVQTFAWTAISG